MIQENFKILSASAGTGKTYRLTKAYLILLLRDNSLNNFRSLLAITFTNKAVAEMKQRILDNLSAFAFTETHLDENPLFEEVATELDVNGNELKERSKKVLKNLLHNYAFFDVSTIDRFNHRLIRTFAKDLNIAQNFEVELDTDYILTSAINQVLAKAGKDELLTSVFIDFALEKIEGGRSWNIAYDLQKIGKLIFQENHHSHLKQFSEKSIQDFISFKQSIDKRVSNYRGEMQSRSKKILEQIKLGELSHDDFYKNWLPDFLLKIIRDPSTINFDAQWKNNLGEGTLYTKNLDQDKKNSIDGLRTLLSAEFEAIKKFFFKATLLTRIQKNIVPLALLSEIQKEIDVIKKVNPFLTINEFNELISKEIKKQPIPYIYERMGEIYQHYFIDEFQDTSILQWGNLVPLIGNALESTDLGGQRGSLVVVGDIKQSIYRWRAGEPQQFMDLISGKTSPFTVTPKIELLEKNWRSHDEIVDFNNNFFSFVANKIDNEEHRLQYIKGNQQESNGKPGGIVQLSFLYNDKKADIHPHCVKALNIIHGIIENGYAHEDICVLVRSKTNEKLIAEYLSKNDTPIISAEGLLLQNNDVVSFLISCIEYVLHPLEKEHTFSILSFLFKDSETLHDNIARHLHTLSSFLLSTYKIDVDKLKFSGALSFFETLIIKLNLVPQSNAYVISFLDEVAEYEKSKTGGLYGFLDYWYQKKDRLALPMPEDISAVSIMTIHKSKGLEFPFVIFPFADDTINDSKKQGDIWIPVDSEQHSGFSELMVSNNKYLPYYSNMAEIAFHEENEKKVLDDFNVLYVALTRAIYGLYIISTPIKEGTAQLSYASLLADYMQSQNLTLKDSEEIFFGKLDSKKENVPTKTQMTIPYINTKISIEDFEVAEQEQMNLEVDEAITFGNLIHSLLAAVYSEEDLPKTISNHIELGWLAKEELSNIENLLQGVVQHDHLKRFFAKHVNSRNEAEIIAENGSVIRPDKLVYDENRVSIIDYKTGTYSENHRLQLEQYESVLVKMGYETDEKILVYIDDKVTTLSI